MSARSTTRTVVFSRPFRLAAIDALLPAGSYVVEAEEELIQDLKFPAYRRTSVWLRLPASEGGDPLGRVVNVDAAELDAAIARDAAIT
jgi:hypothetical protein